VPSFEKVQNLSTYLKTLDIKWTVGERSSTKRFNVLLEEAARRDMSESIGMSVLRTQSQAFYAPESDGHFGLNLSHYAHFTSPIRRYADLVVHRALIKMFELGEDGLSKEEASRLKETGEHISATERQAMAAERDAVDRYIAGWLADKEGMTFSARINGVTKFGLFITLDDTGADGLIPVRELGDEYMVYDEMRQALIGRDTGGTYRLGQRIKAKLVEASPITGGMKFEMKSPPEKGKRPKGGDSRGRSSYKGKRGKGGRRRR
jgi:ribonuclease R